ncbi:MAG: glycerophosphodiester phosphodiesterase [bacterium]|nr:glycerophosphodiester phosphodiesterase [bacterium]
MIIAHRGYAKKYPENTFEAFDAALAAGADALETDVRLAGDGNLVVSHDPVQSAKGLITLDELFAYIAEKKDIPFFLELKDASQKLFVSVAERIASINAWERVHLIGFSDNLKTAVAGQKDFPKLCVDQILQLPLLAYAIQPKKSHAVYIGWLDGIAYSEFAFKAMVSLERLKKLKSHFESKGFKVYGGVLNREDGIRYFQQAGINDIFTDETELAVRLSKTL